MVNDKKADPQTELTRKDRIVLIAIAMVLLCVLTFSAPYLPLHVQDYRVVIFLGILTSLIFVAVTAVYAQLRYKKAGLDIKLGGPVVVFALVVAGAYLHPGIEPLDLTVRLHAQNQPLITSGTIQVVLGNFSRTTEINRDGEAGFKGIPPSFRNQVIKIYPNVEGAISK